MDDEATLMDRTGIDVVFNEVPPISLGEFNQQISLSKSLALDAAAPLAPPDRLAGRLRLSVGADYCSCAHSQARPGALA